MSIAKEIASQTKGSSECITAYLKAKCYNAALCETLDLVDELRHAAQRIISEAAGRGIEINDRRLMTVEEMRNEELKKEVR